MPSVSAAASWMDTFKKSMREIRKQYTKSELVIMAWDSKQKSYNLSLRYKENKHVSSGSTKTEYVRQNGVVEHENYYEMPEDVNKGVPIPKKFFNEEGELDLRQATGPQAVAYLQAVGINIIPRF